MKNKHITKDQAIRQFKQRNSSLLKTETKTTIRCIWNDYIDYLHKEDHISDWQVNNWVHPPFCR